MKKYTTIHRKVVEEFEKLSEEDSKITGVWFEEKYLRVKAYGKAMHSMHAPDGVNAMYKLFKYLFR